LCYFKIFPVIFLLYSPNERTIFQNCIPCLIIGPKGPEPALGFFEKKKPDCPTLVVNKTTTTTTKVLPQRARGRANVFSVYVTIITLTLRFRLRYVTVTGVTFSFTLRYRSGREAQLAFKDPGRHFPVPYSLVGDGFDHVAAWLPPLPKVYSFGGSECALP
jgi:hypothetical protein